MKNHGTTLLKACFYAAFCATADGAAQTTKRQIAGFAIDPTLCIHTGILAAQKAPSHDLAVTLFAEDYQPVITPREARCARRAADGARHVAIRGAAAWAVQFLCIVEAGLSPTFRTAKHYSGLAAVAPGA